MDSEHDREPVQRLKEALLNLPRIQREIFLAVRLDDLSYPEIAQRTGLTPRKVERHFARALHQLDKQLRGRRLNWWERRF